MYDWSKKNLEKLYKMYNTATFRRSTFSRILYIACVHRFNIVKATGLNLQHTAVIYIIYTVHEKQDS